MKRTRSHPSRSFKAASNVLNDMRKKTGQKQAYIEPQKVDVAADPVVKYMSRAALEKAIEKAKEIDGKIRKKPEFH